MSDCFKNQIQDPKIFQTLRCFYRDYRIKGIYAYRRRTCRRVRVFDNDLQQVITDLMQNRLRFNTFVRLFFARIVIQVDRPGVGWRKGKKKGDLPECNSHIVKFALQEKFAAFIEQSHLELPEALKNAECYCENLSDCQGSPSLLTGYFSGTEFVENLSLFFWEANQSC